MNVDPNFSNHVDALIESGVDTAEAIKRAAERQARRDRGEDSAHMRYLLTGKTA
jgi:hypothetical protein